MEVEAAKKPEMDLTQIDGRRPVVMIVDDEPLFLDIVKRRVSRNRHWDVVTFDNPLDALAYLRESPVDVLLSDVYMIELDGVEFLAQARTISPDVVQILMTGERDGSKTIEAINRLDLYFFFDKNRIWKELAVVLRNALERKRLVIDLRKQIKELEETNARLNAIQDDLLRQRKRAVIGELIQGTCHNLNTPLGVILGHSELLHWQLSSPSKSKALNPEELLAKIQTIQDAAERIQDITYNLMLKSRMDQSPKRQATSLADLVVRELKFLQADAFLRHRVDVSEDFNARVPKVMINYGDFSQIFGNLIRNATDAMHEQQNPRIMIATRFDDTHIILELHDTGPGVPKELRERIFDPFFSTKKNVEEPTLETDPGLQDNIEPTGMGLGLYSIKKLLEPYHGHIEVDESPLGGACFRILLPRSENEAPKTTP